MIWQQQTDDCTILLTQGKDGTNYALGSVTYYSDSHCVAHVFGRPKTNITHQHVEVPKGLTIKAHWMFMVEWHVRNALSGSLGPTQEEPENES